MNFTASKPAREITLPEALLMLGGVVALFVGFKVGISGMDSLSAWLEVNDGPLVWNAGAALINCTAVVILLWPLLGPPKQGSHLRAMTKTRAEPKPIALKRTAVAGAIALIAAFVETAAGVGSPIWVTDLPFAIEMANFHLVLSLNFGAAVYFGCYWLLKPRWSFSRWMRRNKGGLPALSPLENGIVLGSDESDPINPIWVPMTQKALNGNILITGGIGSGKTQGAILPYLDQILGNFKPRPSVLAIDPKRMFIKKALQIVESRGLKDHCLHVRFGGSVRYNPIYHPELLKGSRSVEIAQMLRAAAVNSMGRSSNDFWDTSSFNLIRNCLIYCAAVLGYYTLNDLYNVLVKAAKGNLAEDLKRVTSERTFCPEESFNIRQAMTYFDAEFAQFEDRLRTGILASASAFLNQFQDYQAAKIFSPPESEITLKSMDEAVDDGKIILFDIENPALAKALGTVLKLQFQQSVLSRLGSDKRSSDRSGILMIDEYQDVVTSGHGMALGDDRFLAKGREANAITIVATQSLTSLENSLRSSHAAQELFQNFRTRIAAATSDLTTIRAFQEIAGRVEREKVSHSISETSQDARANPFGGGYEAARATNINEGVTTTSQKEYLIAPEDFASLRVFESFAQVYDGEKVQFRSLCLKPHFLKVKEHLQETILAAMKQGAAVAVVLALSGIGSDGALAISMPNLCSVAQTPAFDACAEVEVSGCTCPGIPPRPCAQISYYRPETFVEVMPNAGETFFAALPVAAQQLSGVAVQAAVPFGNESEIDSHAFQSHVLDVPLASLVGNFLPCGGRVPERTCFDAMSEHLGPAWVDGTPDLAQPSFLGWAASPKACVVAGAAQSVTGGMADPGYSPGSAGCSARMEGVGKFPPSTHAACTGWGFFFPRTGVYDGPSQTVAALMVASRIKSLGSEVFQTVARSPDEKWQMILPGPSACFREGQNAAFLETAAQATEVGRLGPGPPKGFLFTIWRRVSCCRDFPEAAALRGELAALKASCGRG